MTNKPSSPANFFNIFFFFLFYGTFSFSVLLTKCLKDNFTKNDEFNFILRSTELSTSEKFSTQLRTFQAKLTPKKIIQTVGRVDR